MALRGRHRDICRHETDAGTRLLVEIIADVPAEYGIYLTAYSHHKIAVGSLDYKNRCGSLAGFIHPGCFQHRAVSIGGTGEFYRIIGIGNGIASRRGKRAERPQP